MADLIKRHWLLITIILVTLTVNGTLVFLITLTSDQVKVAEKAGVSESLVSQIERSKVSPSLDTMLTIADVLEIDLEYLFRDFKKDKKVLSRREFTIVTL